MKIISRIGVSFILFFTLLMPLTVQAQAQFSLLPQAQNPDQCVHLLTTSTDLELTTQLKDNSTRNEVLGCGIITGRISLFMIPFFVTYIINFLLGLSGLICVLFIVIGGYHYVYGGLIEEKEKGKNTIKHALMGLGLALLAWTIVNVLIRAVTG